MKYFIVLSLFLLVGCGGFESASIIPQNPIDDINEDNSPPESESQNLVLNTNQNGEIDLNLVLTDPDQNQELTILPIENFQNGTLSLEDGNYIYRPNPGFIGSDTLIFRVFDGKLQSEVTYTVTISVEGTNRPPTSQSLVLTMTENTTLPLNILFNDLDGDDVSLQVVTGFTDGILNRSGDDYSYTPDLDFVGLDILRFRVFDGSISSVEEYTVSITVEDSSNPPVNQPPTSQNISLSINKNTPQSFMIPASDPDGDSISFIFNNSFSNGNISGSNGNYTYTPNNEFVGIDSISFQVSDGSLQSQVYTVSITVIDNSGPVNNPPVGEDKNLTTDEDTAVNFSLNLSDPDGDSVTFDLLTAPSNGNFFGNYTYLPNNGFFGTDSFTYRVSDGSLNSQVYTITVVVNENVPANSAPIGESISISGPQDQDINFSLNLSDPDGDNITFNLVSGTSNGSFTQNTLTTYTYSPNAAFTGSDSFTYRLSDGQVNSPLYTVSINVTTPNSGALNLTQDTFDINEDTILTLQLELQSGSIDSVSIISLPTEGDLTGTNPFQYESDRDYSGPDSFVVAVTSGGVTENKTISVNVLPVNDRPSTRSVILTVDQGVVNFPLNLTGTDVDGDDLTFLITIDDPNGTITEQNGELFLTPDPSFSGRLDFRYAAFDGELESASDLLRINVTATSSAPSSSDEIVTMFKNSNQNIVIEMSDVDNDVNSIIIDRDALHGTVNTTSNSIQYTPTSGFFGSDKIRFKLDDDAGNESEVYEINIAVIDTEVGPRWESDPLLINFPDMTSDPLRRQAILDAVQKWNDALGFTIFTTQEGATPMQYAEDELFESLSDSTMNIWFQTSNWFEDKESALAIATTGSIGDEIVDADILFNNFGFDWYPDSPLAIGIFDFESVLIHELGHFIGIPHISLVDDPYSVMNPTISSNLEKRLLSLFDLQTVRYKYGEPFVSQVPPGFTINQLETSQGAHSASICGDH